VAIKKNEDKNKESFYILGYILEILYNFSILKIKKIENGQLKNPKNIYFNHFDFIFLTIGENFP
jgi:hypothetical protein